jgi:hypothetical protein
MAMTDANGVRTVTKHWTDPVGELVRCGNRQSASWPAKSTLIFTVLIFFLWLGPADECYGQRSSIPVVRERTEWTNVWIPNADNPDLPRVLLIGNSVTQGYYSFVESIMGENVNLARFTTSSSIEDPVFFEEIKVYLKHYDFAVIHFNNGLHGVHLDVVQYEKGITKLLKYLRKYGKGATLIAATTTRVLPGFPHWGTDEQNLKLVEERNRVLVRVCSERNIPVNDLYSLTKDKPGWFSADNIHYNETGNRELGRQVASAISAGLVPVQE